VVRARAEAMEVINCRDCQRFVSFNITVTVLDCTP
jgi:hypothetical protein